MNDTGHLRLRSFGRRRTLEEAEQTTSPEISEVREFGKIASSIWASRRWEKLQGDTDAQLLYFYFQTCPHGNAIGCFRVRIGYATEDLGWEKERYLKGIDTLKSAGLIGYDEGEAVVRIVDFLKHSPFSNPKHAVGAAKALDLIPECGEKYKVISDIRADKHGKKLAELPEKPPEKPNPPDTLSEGYRNTETETETETITTPSSLLLGEDGEKAYRQFLSLYPAKKVRDSKAGALAFLAAMDSTPAEEIISAVRRYAEAAKAFDPDKIKYSDNWLRDGSWAQYPAPPGEVIDLDRIKALIEDSEASQVPAIRENAALLRKKYGILKEETT